MNVMPATYAIRLLTDPTDAWRQIASSDAPPLAHGLTHTLLFALIPAASWFFGSTQIGWNIGFDERQRLTPESALFICAFFYLALVVGVLFLGYMIHWMSHTYGAASSLGKGVLIVAYTATPFFVGGLLGLYPVLALDLALGVVIACYCVYLLYLGIPIVMDVPPERGFLFASAVVAVGLVSFVAMMGATVILWDLGLEPVYTY
jgi:hypothetical protein